jgi:hypothetical protein
MEEILPELKKAEEEWAKKYEALKKAVEAKDEEQASSLREDLIKGVGEDRRILFLNKRFYALSYLSMRRYVVGGLYLQMKARYLTKPADDKFVQYKALHEEILKQYEEIIVPHLVEADI